MTRNLRGTGLALIIVAMAAISASPAQAELTVTPEQFPAQLRVDAIAPLTFKTGSQEITCINLSGHAALEEAGVGDTNITFTDVKYAECQMTGGLPLTVDMTGCDYLFHGGTEDSFGHFNEGQMDLVCPEKVTGPDVLIYSNASNHEKNLVLCRYTIWAASNLNEVTYTNTSGVRDDFELKVNEVPTSVTRDGSILCGSPTTAKTNARITVTAAGEFSGEVSEIDAEVKNSSVIVPTWHPAFMTVEAAEHSKANKSEQVFTVEGGAEIKCKKASGTITIKERGVGDKSVTLQEPAFSECVAKFGEASVLATVNMTGCDYLIHGGLLDLTCPEGTTGPDVSVFTEENHSTLLCTYRISAFVNHGEMSYKNTTGTKKDFDITATGVSTPVNREGSVLCGTPKEAKYTGTVTARAYNDFPQIGVTVSSE